MTFSASIVVSDPRGFLTNHGGEHLLHDGLALIVRRNARGGEKRRGAGSGGTSLIFDLVSGLQKLGGTEFPQTERF